MLYFFFLGLFQSLLTAILLFRKADKKPADIYLLLLVICFSLQFLSSFLLYELVSNAYFRKGFLHFVLLAYGPLLLLYAKKTKDESYSFAKDWWLLAPAAICSIIYICILGLWMAHSFTNFSLLQLYNRSLLFAMGPVNIPCFIVAIRIANAYPQEKVVFKNLIRTSCIAGISAITVGLALSFYMVINNVPFGILQHVVRIIGSLGLITVSLTISKYALLHDRPKIFTIHTDPSPKTSRPPQLSKERQKEMYEQLADLVKEGRLFLDPDLNMEKLTTAIGYSRHQVSEILNQYADTSFYPFINRFRVDEVCKQMKLAAAKNNFSSLNMLDLSYVCGFKSKSSFNEYFRRFKGQTPSEYLNELVEIEKRSN